MAPSVAKQVHENHWAYQKKDWIDQYAKCHYSDDYSDGSESKLPPFA